MAAQDGEEVLTGALPVVAIEAVVVPQVEDCTCTPVAIVALNPVGIVA